MNSIFTPFPDTLWVRKEIKFGYSCSLCQILHSWYRQSSFLHSATPRARDGLSVSLSVVQDFAEKALVPKLDSYISVHISADSCTLIFSMSLVSYCARLIKWVRIYSVDVTQIINISVNASLPLPVCSHSDIICWIVMHSSTPPPPTTTTTKSY